MSVLRGLNDQKLIYLRLLLRHIVQFTLFHNSLLVSKQVLTNIKDLINQPRFQKGVSRLLLEGAYKIMVFSTSSVINGRVVSLDGNKMERNISEGMKESIEITNLI